MMPIGLLALDLDDTLLRSDLSISFRTRNAIKRVQGAGIAVVLVSGRIPAAMERFSRTLKLHKKPGYLICNNGALILESHTGKIVYQAQINPKVGLFVADMAAAEGFPVQIYEDGLMYVSKANEFASHDEKVTGVRQVIVENFHDLVAKGCHKLIIPGDPMLLKPLELLLRSYLREEEANLFTSKPYFLEILPAGTDKGSSLARVAEMLGVDRGAVLAVGDSMNDEAMIRWAGVGVAMANSDDRIKAVARLVTEKSNDDDGVAEIIDRYVLGNEPVPAREAP